MDKFSLIVQGYLNYLFHIGWLVVVCGFWRIGSFHLSYKCRIVHSNFSFDVRWVCSDILCFIPDIGNLCPLSFFLSVLLKVYQFYWYFQRTSSLFHWFLSIVFLFSFINFCSFLLFSSLSVLWVYFGLFFFIFKLKYNWHITLCKFKVTMCCEFPGGLVVRIPGFHCCSLGSIPDGGAEIPQAVLCSQKKQVTMCWLDTFIYCNMIIPVALANTSITSHNYHFFFVAVTVKI